MDIISNKGITVVLDPPPKSVVTYMGKTVNLYTRYDELVQLNYDKELVKADNPSIDDWVVF